MGAASLATLADEHVRIAREAPSGRSAQTLVGGPGRTLRQTLLALSAGNGLAEHESPGDATVQVLRGRVLLSAGSEEHEGTVGDLLVIPRTRHRLDALDDAVVLLTVARAE